MITRKQFFLSVLAIFITPKIVKVKPKWYELEPVSYGCIPPGTIVTVKDIYSYNYCQIFRTPFGVSK